MTGLVSRWLEPDVSRHLLADEGEFVVDEVAKHWAANLQWYLLILASAGMFLLMMPARELFWLPMALGMVGVAVAVWKCHVNYMDRFVVTNMRVFRMHGVFNQHLATMPMTRILDISLNRPFLGQLFGYGHFVFESAAQAQGLKQVSFVGRPEERDLTIQRVVQRAGLRKAMSRTGS